MHLKAYISYWVRISKGFLLHFTTLHLKSSHVTTPREPVYTSFFLTRFTKQDLHYKNFSFVWTWLQYFQLYAPGVCDILVICQKSADVQLIVRHQRNKHPRTCSQGPHHIASMFVDILRKNHVFCADDLCCGGVVHAVILQWSLICTVRKFAKERRTKKEESYFSYYYSAPFVMSLRTPALLPFIISSYECQNIEG